MSVIEIKPSRLLVILVMAVHLAAAFSFLFAPDPTVWGPGLAVIGVSAALSWRGWQRRGGMRLGLGDDGCLILAPGDDEDAVVLRASTVVVAPVVWLAWDGGRTARPGVMMILRDQVAPAQWRVLQVWLRLRARTAKPGGPPASESA